MAMETQPTENPKHERTDLYAVAYLVNGQEKFAYLHARDIGDATFQILRSRRILEKNAYFVGVGKVIGWVEADKPKIQSFGGL
jgi:hypothetical protein